MSRTIYAKLVQYRRDDGEFRIGPVMLEGNMVVDDEHGLVLEFVLPASGNSDWENAILIPVSELKKL